MTTEESPSKKQRLTDDSVPIADPIPNDVQKEAIADASNHSPDIFRLTIDCFDEIFEYLSLADVYSVGQTCKRLQKVAGTYYKHNFPAAVKCLAQRKEICLHSHRQNKYTEIPAFAEFVKHVEIHQNVSMVMTFNQVFMMMQPENQQNIHFQQLHAIESRASTTSINRISFVESNFDVVDIQHIRNILAKVEAVDIQKCYLRGDFCQKLLECCTNLKRLNIQNSHIDVHSNRNHDARNQWMHRQYPLLEHFKLILHESIDVDELKEFLEQNPTLCSFSTNSERLCDVCDQLFECSSKLDVLKVKYDAFTDSTTVCDIIKKLHAQGFYKRLHIEVGECDEDCSIGLATLPSLEKLCIKRFMRVHRLSSLTGLKELAILKNVNAIDMDILARLLGGLKRVFLFNASLADILPFIRCSVNLMKIKVYPKDETSFTDGILNLAVLNKEREKLPGARKVMIYVPDKMFLKTKWAVKDGNIDFDFVEMQRYDLYSWGMNE